MSRPNAKISFGIAGALWFAILLVVALLYPDSMTMWQMWTGSSLFCIIAFFVGYASLTADEARQAEQREALQNEVVTARLAAERAKARAEEKQHNLIAAQSIHAMRQLGRAHNTPTAAKHDAEVQEWYIRLVELAQENNSGVGSRALRQYFTGKSTDRLFQWQKWIAEPFAERKWIAPVVEAQPTVLLVTLDRILGHLYAGDLPKYPALPLPRMNWKGEQGAGEALETSGKQAETVRERSEVTA